MWLTQPTYFPLEVEGGGAVLLIEELTFIDRVASSATKTETMLGISDESALS